MQLTLVAMALKRIPGHLFRGKHRLVRKVKLNAMNALVRDFEQTERNMLLLRHPYLTLEESSGHAKALQKHEKFIARCNDMHLELKRKPHVTIEDRLNHLKIKDVWDV